MFLIDPKKIVAKLSEASSTVRRAAQVRMNQRMVQLQHRLNLGLGRHK